MYATDTVAAAMLETLVYAGHADLLDATMYSVLVLDVPEALVVTLDAVRLPDDWSAPWYNAPQPTSAQRIGKAWVLQQVSPVLKVPSVLVTGWHSNYLINPQHPAADALSVVDVQPLAFDPRLAPRLSS